MRYPSLSVILFIIFTISVAQGQEVVYLIRHAEQEPYLDDQPLTYAGHQRAKAWASILRDAGIKVIYTSNKQRALQTGEHIAQALSIPLESIPRKDIDGLLARLHTEHGDDRVLIVSHSRTVPKLLKALGYPVRHLSRQDQSS